MKLKMFIHTTELSKVIPASLSLRLCSRISPMETMDAAEVRSSVKTDWNDDGGAAAGGGAGASCGCSSHVGSQYFM